MASALIGLLRHVTLTILLQACALCAAGENICSSPERSVLLSCGRSIPKQGQWYFNDPSSLGIPLGLRDSSKSFPVLRLDLGRQLTLFRDSALLLQNLQPSDTGVYTCVEGGTENIITQVNLYVVRDGGGPCGFTKSPASRTTSPVSSTTSLASSTTSPAKSTTLTQMSTDTISTSAPLSCECSCAVQLVAICLNWDCSACTD